ncbi:MAG: GNAT family N-acetyltransferase [Actinomycetota bacterium]
MSEIRIGVEDPRGDDIVALLRVHLDFSHGETPPEDAHALDVDGLCDPSITFYAARTDGQLLGVGAIRRLDDHHGEIKSMHTAAAARGTGVGRRMVGTLLDHARAAGFGRVSLETGTTEAFEPARRLYAACGFERGGPFGSYTAGPNNVFFTIELSPD